MSLSTALFLFLATTGPAVFSAVTVTSQQSSGQAANTTQQEDKAQLKETEHEAKVNEKAAKAQAKADKEQAKSAKAQRKSMDAQEKAGQSTADKNATQGTAPEPTH